MGRGPARERGARRGDRLAIAGTALLAVLVAALVLSWAWTRLGPGRESDRATGTQPLVRVQIWNGSGEGGVAGRLASFLREGGFHVVEVRNADRDDYFATLVVARREDPAAALAVAHYLGGLPVIRQAWGSDQADVTVVVGSDRSRLRLGQ
jgi:hypothetical protein